MKLHVLTTKAELKKEQLKDKVVIVLDILIATTSIVTALANGCKQIVPVRNYDQAMEYKAKAEFTDYKFSGELNADTLSGFIDPTPIALLAAGMNDAKMVYCTTNGTVALNDSFSAKEVFVGSLLNAQAIVDYLLKKNNQDSVLVVCSGSNDQFNVEDFYGAGFFVQSFLDSFPKGSLELSDCAHAARIFHASGESLDLLNLSRVGKMLNSRGADKEVVFAAQKNIYPIIPKLTPAGYVEQIL
jgi:2-phosphosulfolactate phosphatase